MKTVTRYVVPRVRILLLTKPVGVFQHPIGGFRLSAVLT